MSSVRTQRLHELVDKALDNTVSSLGGPLAFARCFAISGDARERLSARYVDAIASFRANVKVRAARARHVRERRRALARASSCA